MRLMDNQASVFDAADAVLCADSVDEKCRLAKTLQQRWQAGELHLRHASAPRAIGQPGRPARPQLVHPSKLKKRSFYTDNGRISFMHAVAHIEFNAIDLACDAVYRYRDLPADYYQDWISVAADEARHFLMIQDYLEKHGCRYGDLPAHNGLWDMAMKTADDILARLALVPRVLEARGLDVTPGMIDALQQAGDDQAAAILQIIYREEIAHVAAGSRWFNYVCGQRGVDAEQHFIELLNRYLGAAPRGPYNLDARRDAGFSETELQMMQRTGE